MIPISKALRLIAANTNPLGTENVPLADSVGRILAEPVVADTDLPPFDRSMMDGYAVIAADTLQRRSTGRVLPGQNPAQSKGIMLEVAGESSAGHGWDGRLKRGQAVRIMTGARVPAGADAVQRVEVTRESDGIVVILEPVKKGMSIVRRGAEIKKGKVIFKAGEVITESMIAALASFGYSKVKVGRRPHVAILGTGSEIVDIAKKPGRDQIRNSNSVMLDVLARHFGAETTILPATGDDILDLKFQISNSIKAQRPKAKNQRSDILIITGGVSVGKYDLTKQALIELGAEIFFEKVRLKPGKPAVFARLGKTLVFGLPGNPVSAAVTFHLFVRKALMLMQGASATGLRLGTAVAGANVKAAKDRDIYAAARIETDAAGRLIATPLRTQGSSDLASFARADALVFAAAGTAIKQGEAATIAFI